MFQPCREQLFRKIIISVCLDCSSKCLINVLTLPTSMCRFHMDKNSLWFIFYTILRLTLLKGKKVAGLSLLFGPPSHTEKKRWISFLEHLIWLIVLPRAGSEVSEWSRFKWRTTTASGCEGRSEFQKRVLALHHSRTNDMTDRKWKKQFFQLHHFTWPPKFKLNKWQRLIVTILIRLCENWRFWFRATKKAKLYRFWKKIESHWITQTCWWQK